MSLHHMVRLGVPVVPPAHTAEGLQVTAVEVCAGRDAEAFLLAHSLSILGGDTAEGGGGEEHKNSKVGPHVSVLTFHRDC